MGKIKPGSKPRNAKTADKLLWSAHQEKRLIEAHAELGTDW